MHEATKPGTAKKLKVAGLDTYFGGKGAMGAYQKIINQIPPCERFIELCLGGGSVTRWMRPAAHHIGVDVDAQVVQLWRAAQLPWLEVRHQSALEYLAELAQLPDLSRTVLYVDPPYPLKSRKSSRHKYRHEMSDAGHIALLEALLRLSQRADRPSIIISTYPNEIYSALLKEWRLEQFQSQTQWTHEKTTELLYFNFATPETIHDPRFVGQNFRERWRVKKQCTRWVANFNKMPPHQRQLIFALLAADRSNHAPDEELAGAQTPALPPAPVAEAGHPRRIGRGAQVKPQLDLFESTSAATGAVVEAPSARAAA